MESIQPKIGGGHGNKLTIVSNWVNAKSASKSKITPWQLFSIVILDTIPFIEGPQPSPKESNNEMFTSPESHGTYVWKNSLGIVGVWFTSVSPAC